jgi:hypothetical protein
MITINTTKQAIPTMLGLGMVAASAMAICGFASSAQALPAGLTHEWSFNTSTTSGGYNYSPDSVTGSANYNALLANGTTVSSGQAVLTNNNVTSGAAGLNYVSLPVSALPTTSPTVSFEEWFTGSYDYQSGTSGNVYPQNRGFDFNNDTVGVGAGTDNELSSPNQTTGAYMYQSLDTGGGISGTGISAAGWGSETSVHTSYEGPGGTNYYSSDWLTQPGANGQPLTHMIAVVINQTPTSSAAYGTLTYYVDGINFGSTNLTKANQWTAVSPSFTNAWLGRSAFNGDGVFNGTIDEFRIYNTALSSAQVAADATAGPNAFGTVPIPEPTTILMLGLSAGGLLLLRRRSIKH